MLKHLRGSAIERKYEPTFAVCARCSRRRNVMELRGDLVRGPGCQYLHPDNWTETVCSDAKDCRRAQRRASK